MAEKRHWVIGRAPECDIVMGQSGVSAKHCRLTRDVTSWLLEDLGSSNGTFVNGRRLPANSPVAVHHGDAIAIGTTALPWPEKPAPQAPRLAKTVLAGAPSLDLDLDVDRIPSSPRQAGPRTPVTATRSSPPRSDPPPPR